MVQRSTTAEGKTVWTLTLRKLERLPYSDGKVRTHWWREDFDAVVVASGRFDSPSVPNIVGLDQWAKAFPERIYHSREYRKPEELAGKVQSDIPLPRGGTNHEHRMFLSLEVEYLRRR